MTIQELAAKLDDYSGALSQEVEKLQLERSRGTLHQDEQLDLVGDLREAVKANLIRPWRSKAVWSMVVGLLFLAVAVFLPATLANSEIYRWVAFGLAVVAIFRAGFSLWTLLKYRNLECKWLRKVEDAVKQGGTVFDVQ